jgi:two-component system alkaline phosphatase synthesis response regulator PhoP
MTKLSVLLIEDETNLGLTLSEYLNGQKYQCHWFTSYKDFQKDQNKLHPQLAILDINLPDINGLELATMLKKLFPDIIFLFMSAQNEPELRLKGFEIGASDYITKPFSLKELILRIDRIAQTEIKDVDTVTIGSISINFDRYTLIDIDGSEASLGHKECSILKILYLNKNKVVSREQLIDEVWGKNSFPSNRTIDNYIVKFRKWIDADPSNIAQIKSIRGIGYKLEIKESS